MAAKIVDQKTADYWNKRGETYSISWQSVAKKRLSKLETDLIRGVVGLASKSSGSGRIKTLDIGVGIGRISEVVLEYEVEHHGIDISQTMIDYCGEKFKGNDKVKQLMIHDIVNPLPEGWGKFGVVTAIRVLSYTPLWRKKLRNVYEAMSPGGVLVCTFPNKYSSILVPKMLLNRELPGNEISCSELKRAIEEAGFSEYRIEGFSRLLDVFYDWCDSEFSANVLFGIEKVLGSVFGPTLFARLFYVTCKK